MPELPAQPSARSALAFLADRAGDSSLASQAQISVASGALRAALDDLDALRSGLGDLVATCHDGFVDDDPEEVILADDVRDLIAPPSPQGARKDAK